MNFWILKSCFFTLGISRCKIFKKKLKFSEFVHETESRDSQCISNCSENVSKMSSSFLNVSKKYFFIYFQILFINRKIWLVVNRIKTSTLTENSKRILSKMRFDFEKKDKNFWGNILRLKAPELNIINHLFLDTKNKIN